MIENYETFYLSVDGITYCLRISDDLYEKLAHQVVEYINNKIFKKDYTVCMNLDFKKDILLCEVDKSETKSLDNILKYENSVGLLNYNKGFDISITYNSLSLNFSIFTIKKQYRFNKHFFQNLFRKNQKQNNIDYKDITIECFNNYLCEYDNSKNKNVSFELIINSYITEQVAMFFDNFCKNIKKFNFLDYSPIIYFENDEIDNYIRFNIENVKLEFFRISFIQNRLFFIVVEDNKVKLFLNYIYLSPSVKNKKIIFLKMSNTEDNNYKLYYNKNDNTYMLNRILLSEYDLNIEKIKKIIF